MAKPKRPARARGPKGGEGSTRTERYTYAEIDAMIAAVGSIPDTPIESKFLGPDGKLWIWRSRREELADRVRGAGDWFVAWRYLQGRAASPSRLATEMKSLAAAATCLHMVLRRFDRNAPKLPAATRFLEGSIQEWLLKQEGYTDAEIFPQFVEVTRHSPRPAGSERGAYDWGYETILQWIETVELMTVVVNFAETNARNLMRSGRSGEEARHKGDEALHRFIGDLMEIYRDVFQRNPTLSRPSGGGPPHGRFIRFVDAALRPLGVEISAESIAGYTRSRKHRSKRA